MCKKCDHAVDVDCSHNLEGLDMVGSLYLPGQDMRLRVRRSRHSEYLQIGRRDYPISCPLDEEYGTRCDPGNHIHRPCCIKIYAIQYARRKQHARDKRARDLRVALQERDNGCKAAVRDNRPDGWLMDGSQNH